MITTIQIHQNVKKELERFKVSKNESYEEVIISLLKNVQKQRRKNLDLLKEGAIVMAEESLKITKEFEAIEEGWEW